MNISGCSDGCELDGVAKPTTWSGPCPGCIEKDKRIAGLEALVTNLRVRLTQLVGSLAPGKYIMIPVEDPATCEALYRQVWMPGEVEKEPDTGGVGKGECPFCHRDVLPEDVPRSITVCAPRGAHARVHERCAREVLEARLDGRLSRFVKG